MVVCPACGDEFEPGVGVCPDDGSTLVPREQVAAVRAATAAPVDASLGTFHPRIGVELRRLLGHRGVPHRVVDVDDARAELRVPAAEREGLRARLALEWSTILRALPPDDLVDVRTVGPDQYPGWHDAPRGSWVDRDGQLRVAGSDDDAMADAQRNLGPALAAGGVVLALLGWAQGGSELLYLSGGAGVVLGLLLPR